MRRVSKLCFALLFVAPPPSSAAPKTVAPSIPALVPSAPTIIALPARENAVSILYPLSSIENIPSTIAAPEIRGTGEMTSAHASQLFDAASVRERLDEPISGMQTEAVRPRIANAARKPKPAPSGDDGGGPSYPSRPVAYNDIQLPSVAFRPNAPVETLIVQAIDHSRQSIQIALYEFTSRAILNALFAARKRGVKIEIILDDTSVNPRNKPDAPYQRRRSEEIWSLVREGFDVRVVGRPTEYGILHHKFAVFDGKMAEYGSYNWTYTSELYHYENVLFSAEPDRVAAYQAVWKQLRSLSVTVSESRDHSWPLDVPLPPADTRKKISFNHIRLPAWIFTPNEGFEDAVAAAIDASNVRVDAAAFVLESRRIADALARALERKVEVRIVADESQSVSERAPVFLGWLARRGAQVRIHSGPHGPDGDHPLAEKMHNKFFVFDGKLVETGSANPTKNASINNFENANFIDDAGDAKAFQYVFDHLFAASRPLQAVPNAEPPSDEELRAEALKPRAPEAPSSPKFDPLPPAGKTQFNGIEYPASAVRPHEPVETHIVNAVDSARKSVRMAIYDFNQKEVLDALRRAKRREGVSVEIVLDRAHVYTTGRDEWGEPRHPKPEVAALIKEGFDVLLVKGSRGGIQHQKFLIVDDGLVQFGSYNYSDQSETDHFDAAFFRTEPARVTSYRREFDYLRSQGEAPDLARLEEALTRTIPVPESATLEEASGLETAVTGPKASVPTPPQDRETPIEFNGLFFPLQMFSPNGGIERALIEAIGKARATIDIAMFSFFSRPIAEALLRAKDNGVAIRIAMDRSQAALSKLDEWFAWHGIDVRVSGGPDDDRDPRYQKMHHKFADFDGKMLVAGSFNYSPTADLFNHENANFFDDPAEIARFAAAFAQIFARAKAPRPPKNEPQWALPAPTDS